MLSEASFDAPELVAAVRCPLNARLLPSTAGTQAPVHGVLGHRMAELAIDCCMNVGSAHRAISRRQNLDDRSLHDAIPEPSRRRYERRAKPHRRFKWRIRQTIEHPLQT